MSYLGSWKIDDYLSFCCNTHDPDTGVATDADAVPSYRIYEDETATPILTGTMSLLNAANTTGFYSERIQLTAANGFEKGKCYTIYITATVDSDTGTMHHNFQIEAEVDANTVSGAVTPADDSITAAKIAADAFTSDELATSALNEIADAVWDELSTDHVDAGKAGQQLWTDIDAILTDTNELQTDDIPGSIAALNDVSEAQVNAQVDTALTDIHLDHLLAADYNPASKPGIATALLNELVESDGGVSRYTANALEQAPSGSGASAATIADAVWDETIADHAVAGSTGKALANAASELGAGAIAFTYTLTSSIDSTPIPDADVWVTSDQAGNTVIASSETDSNGQITFYLDTGTVYIWRQKSGWNFTNPDTETVA